MGDATGTELNIDENKRLRQHMAEELHATHEKLVKTLSDLHEATETAMSIALRLDACEKRLEETEAELHEVRTVELADMRALSSEQAEIMSRQVAYINRLREQVRHPIRIMAKRLLGPAVRVVRPGDSQ